MLYDPALDAFADEQRVHTASLMELTAGMADIDTSSPEGLQWLRDAMEPGGLFGMQCLDFPETRTIAGPAGPIPIRVLTPERVDGVYLHFHGGGMTIGSARGHGHPQLADRAGVQRRGRQRRLPPRARAPVPRRARRLRGRRALAGGARRRRVRHRPAARRRRVGRRLLLGAHDDPPPRPARRLRRRTSASTSATARTTCRARRARSCCAARCRTRPRRATTPTAATTSATAPTPRCATRRSRRCTPSSTTCRRCC